MLPQDLKQEIINNWMDCDKLVALIKYPDPISCDNGLLFTSTFVMLCYLLGILKDEDAQQYTTTVKRCEAEEGCYHRNPGRTDRLNEHDDHDAVASTSSLIGERLHIDIYRYGKKHWWYYNNTNPGSIKVNGQFSLRPFRLPHSILIYKLLSGKRACIISWLWFIVNCILSTFGQGTSSKILNWTRLEALSQHIRIFRYMKSWYLNRLKKKFKGPLGNGMIEVFRIYYPENHPTVMLAKYYFE